MEGPVSLPLGLNVPAPLRPAAAASAARPLSDEERAEHLVAQFYETQVNPRDPNGRIPPIFGSGYEYLRGSSKSTIQAVLDLYRQSLDGYVAVKKLYDVVRKGMNTNDLYLTHMTDEALEDLFGGKRVGLNDAMLAAALIRYRFTFEPEKYNFNTYRQAKTFYHLPDGLYANVKNSQYLRRIKGSQYYEHMLRHLMSLGLTREAARREAETSALTYQWQDFIQFCFHHNIDLKKLNMRNPVTAGKIREMLDKYDRKVLEVDELKAELKRLKHTDGQLPNNYWVPNNCWVGSAINKLE